MEFLEVPLFDDDLFKMLVRFGVNLIFVCIIVWGCYHQFQKNHRYVFTFMLMNVMVFFICFTLKKLDLGLGMALGLFAIFAIIRYRTDAIKVKEMTYLFIVIGIAVINALSNKQTSYAELLFTNVAIVVATYLLEQCCVTDKPATQNIVYDKLDLLKPDNRTVLLKDIRERTGLEATEVKIVKIDLQKGLANIAIHYRRTEQ
jgi:hypothetical protein